VLKITLGGSYELLIGVASVVVIIVLVAIGDNPNSLGPLPWPSLVTHGASFCSLVGGCGQSSQSTACSCLPAILHEDCPYYLLSRGVPGGIAKEILSGLWLFKDELMH
jgi:hypothetical protein